MTLFLVSTPIGNLGDMTFRAVETLKACDLILCEDTRRTLTLLRHYGIEKPLLSFNEHNTRLRLPRIMAELSSEKDVALVTDNGTPGISDPGSRLVSEAVRNSIKVSPIPGPSAVTSAISCSGADGPFMFYGFFPKKGRQREEIIKKEGTVVFYESPHRINKTLEYIDRIAPDRKLCICREMTKKFEEFLVGTAKELMGKKLKGEIVVVLYP
jgi:16S rRNA (cytidine1402-2'-O)-methyltransferase